MNSTETLSKTYLELANVLSYDTVSSRERELLLSLERCVILLPRTKAFADSSVAGNREVRRAYDFACINLRKYPLNVLQQATQEMLNK